MRTLLIAAATALAFATPAFAQAPAGDYVVDKTHASLTWKGVHQGLAWYNARFVGFDAALTFNEADVSKSKVSVTIDPKSIETDYARTRPATSTTDFNKEVAEGANFLNGAKFPTITYVSKTITKTGDKTGKMVGDLTFLGVTKPVTLDVTYIGNRNDPRSQKHKVGFNAVGKFKRTDFGMPAGGPIGDEIQIVVDAEFVQK
jgi:polyisoprenoid-binding protein YceI